MSEKFACSLLAKQTVGRGFTINHTVCMVEAINEYEATGKGMTIALKGFPVAEGWSDHHVQTCSATIVIDPEKPVIRKDGPVVTEFGGLR